MTVTAISLNDIRIDGGTQSRTAIDQDVVAEYAEAIRAGVSFPPVILFHDRTDYWLADGFHRWQAHHAVGVNEIAADVRQGTRRDAVLFGVGANQAHGLRRSSADKRKAITILLTDELVSRDDKGNPWSDREIGRLCGVDHKTVAKVRENLLGEIPQIRAVTRNGTTYTQNTAHIGKRSAQAAADRAEAGERVTSPVQAAPAAPTVASMPDPAEAAKAADLMKGILTAYSVASFALDPIVDDVLKMGVGHFVGTVRPEQRADARKTLGSAVVLAAVVDALTEIA